MPRTVFQTYIHDDNPGPREICAQFLPDFERTFCNDGVLLTTMSLHAGTFGSDICTNRKQPAHSADVLRYIYHYNNHGGLYMDIKFALRVKFDRLLQLIAQDWDSVHNEESEQRGLGPNPQAACLVSICSWLSAKSKIMFSMASSTPRCLLKEDMGKFSWNVSATYGPIYLLQEYFDTGLSDRGELANDGHYFVTKKQVCVAYNRCWNWHKSFKGGSGATGWQPTRRSGDLQRILQPSRHPLSADARLHSLSHTSHPSAPASSLPNISSQTSASTSSETPAVPDDSTTTPTFMSQSAATPHTTSAPNPVERPAAPIEKTISMADVKYRGLVDIQDILDYDSGP